MHLQLASRPPGWLLLTSILLLSTPAQGMQRPGFKHISQRAYFDWPLKGPFFEFVGRVPHPDAPLKTPSRFLPGPQPLNMASKGAYGAQHPSKQPRQFPSTRRQPPEDSRLGPEERPKHEHQPALQTRHFSNTRQYPVDDYRPAGPRTHRGDQPKQPNYQLQYQIQQPPSSAHERQWLLRDDAESLQMGLSIIKPYMPQYRLGPKLDQLRGAVGTGPGPWARWKGASRTEADSTSIEQLRQSPVFQILQATHDGMQPLGSRTKHSSRRLHLQPQCQLQESQLHMVTTAAVAYAAAPSQPTSSDEARETALALRSIMYRAWMEVLQPYSQPGQDRGSGRSSRCKSVGLNPRPAHRLSFKTADDIKHSTALVLVLGDWASLGRLLQLYAINLFTIWCYARQHGYALELYVHDEPLPHHLPIYYIKVLGVRHTFDQLGYQHALYLDFDTFTSPHSAPPLELLYDEAPGASLLMQAELNMCAGVMMWRNTPDAAFLLQAWWDVGATGCCPTFPHDQTALKQVMLAYMANITGLPWVYGREAQRRFKLPSSPSDITGKRPKVLTKDQWPLQVSTLRRLHPALQQAGSAIGFVGLDAQQPFGKGLESSYSHVVLHNCLGIWDDCVPPHLPSLLYHTGHWVMEKIKDPQLAVRMLDSVRDWTRALDLQHI